MSEYAIGLHKWDVDTPALCLDIEALERNIARMADYLRERPAALRPHTKTHKCPTIAWKQLEAGAIGVTCAKLGEAEVMARAGIQDILIANQIVGPRKISRLVGLARESRVMVTVDDLDNARQLSAAVEASGIRLRALIEVDVGMGRCGLADRGAVTELAQAMSAMAGIRLEGLMGYEGHTVMLPDPKGRRAAAEAAMAQLIETRDAVQEAGIRVAIVSSGGTGTYDFTGDYAGVTEIQAGSYATMDARYQRIVPEFETAVTVVAQVISAREDRVIIDAGLKTLTPEFGLPELLYPAGWKLSHQSEEHSTLIREEGQQLKNGDRVEIVPSHGCTTINLHDAYHVVRGERITAIWPIASRGRVR